MDEKSRFHLHGFASVFLNDDIMPQPEAANGMHGKADKNIGELRTVPDRTSSARHSALERLQNLRKKKKARDASEGVSSNCHKDCFDYSDVICLPSLKERIKKKNAKLTVGVLDSDTNKNASGHSVPSSSSPSLSTVTSNSSFPSDGRGQHCEQYTDSYDDDFTFPVSPSRDRDSSQHLSSFTRPILHSSESACVQSVSNSDSFSFPINVKRVTHGRKRSHSSGKRSSYGSLGSSEPYSVELPAGVKQVSSTAPAPSVRLRNNSSKTGTSELAFNRVQPMDCFTSKQKKIKEKSKCNKLLKKGLSSPNDFPMRHHSKRQRHASSEDDIFILNEIPAVNHSDVESDEALARHLQEEMDQEFAAALANEMSSQAALANEMSPQAVLAYEISTQAALANGVSTAIQSPLMNSVVGRRHRTGSSSRWSVRDRRSRRGDPGTRNHRMYSFSGGAGYGLNYVLSSPGNDYEELLQLAEQLGEVKQKGLRSQDIERLPTRVFTNKQSSDGEIPSCNVCFCEFELAECIRMLPCLHEFHAPCIDKWLKTNATCPICRCTVDVS